MDNYTYCLIPRDEAVKMGKYNNPLREELYCTVLESALDAIGWVSAENNRYETNPAIFGLVFDYLKGLNKGYVVTYNDIDYLIGTIIPIENIVNYSADGVNIMCFPMEMINDIIDYCNANTMTSYDLRHADFMGTQKLPDIFTNSWTIWKQDGVTFPPVKVANALQIGHSEQPFYPVRIFKSTCTVNFTYREEDLEFQSNAQFFDNSSGTATYDYTEQLLTGYNKGYIETFNEYYNTLDEQIPEPPAPESVVIGLVNAYNPDGNGLLEFARWLWETDALADVTQEYKSPVNTILGTRLIYVKPGINEEQENIFLGNIDTKVLSNVCNSLFVSVDCGTIFIEKEYNNVHDFRDVTITLYLPFIGYNDIDTALCMGNEIHVTYKVNILNGDCVAYVEVIEQDDISGVASQLETYTYSGNMGVSIPINGSVSNMSDVDLNNPLAMLSHIPYVDVIRPIPYEPQNKNKYEGLPSNETVQLANVTGYTKCKTVFIEGLTATSTEIDTIKQLLESGVIL